MNLERDIEVVLCQRASCAHSSKLASSFPNCLGGSSSESVRLGSRISTLTQRKCDGCATSKL